MLLVTAGCLASDSLNAKMIATPVFGLSRYDL